MDAVLADGDKTALDRMALLDTLVIGEKQYHQDNISQEVANDPDLLGTLLYHSLYAIVVQEQRDELTKELVRVKRQNAKLQSNLNSLAVALAQRSPTHRRRSPGERPSTDHREPRASQEDSRCTPCR